METTATQQMISEGLWEEAGNGKLRRTAKAIALNGEQNDKGKG